MIIESLHIENFGGLTKYDITFNSTIHSILEQNGWGKSTIAAFIKAMLYGLDEKKSTKILTERTHYFPWSGGIFGGNMVFSYHDKKYKVTRTFDQKKKANDTCSIIDLVSKLPAPEFSLATGNDTSLGIMLFDLDKESFERSCFITIGQTPNLEVSDTIKAKLNDLLQDADDAGNFQSADNLLKEQIAALTGRSTNSEIPRLKRELESNTERLNTIDAEEKTIQSKLTLLTQEKQQRDAIQKEIEKLEQEKRNSVLFEKKKLYNSLQSTLKTKQNDESSLIDFFNGVIPDTNTFTSMRATLSGYMQATSAMESEPVTQTDRDAFSSLTVLFNGTSPNMNEIEQCQQNVNALKRINQEAASKKMDNTDQQKLDQLNQMFSGKKISPELINEHKQELISSNALSQEIKTLELQIQEITATVETQKNTHKKSQKTWRIICAVITVICAGGAITLLCTGANKLLSIPFFIIATLGICGFFFKKTKTSENNTIEQQLKNLTAAHTDKIATAANQRKCCTDFIANIIHTTDINEPMAALVQIENDYNRYCELTAKDATYQTFMSTNNNYDQLKNDIAEFTSKYISAAGGTSDIDQILINVRNKAQLYTKYAQKITRYDTAAQSATSNKNKLTEWFSAYKTNKTENYEAQLTSLQENAMRLQATQKSIAEETVHINEFTQNNDMTAIDAAQETTRSTSQLENEIATIKNKLNNVEHSITVYETDIERLSSETDKRADIENKKKQTEEAIVIAEKKAAIYEQARELLTKANDNLSNRYMSKMETSFNTYMKQLTEQDTIFINRDFGVNIERDGIAHSGDFLSSGYKDLVNFCTRMALVDAMFETEKPVIILDDPFINLDKEKIVAAKQILSTVAQKEQLIYFTCHDSRSVNN